jgi:hypothetical protein
MANSYVEIPVTGVDSYTFPFPYLEQSHIQVYAGGVLQTLGVHYTFTDSNTIEFSTGNVPTDTNIVIFIKRVTDDSGRLVTYSNTGLDADDLNLGSNQNFYLAQEAVDAAELNVTRGLDGVSDVGGRLTNVTDPIDSQDAATKAYVASQLTQSATGEVYIQEEAPTGILIYGTLWVKPSNNLMSVWTASGWSTGGIVESETLSFTGADVSPFGLYYVLTTFVEDTINQLFLNGVLLKECTTALDFTTGDWDRSSTLIAFNSPFSADDEITITTSTKMSQVLADSVVNVSGKMDDYLNIASSGSTGGLTLKQEEIATASQTVFNLTNSYIVGTNNISVYVNGVRQSAYVETDTTTITFNNPLTLGDEVLFLINEFNATVIEQVIVDEVETARDATLVSQQAALVSQQAAEAAKDVIVDGDYLQHKLGTVQIEANTSLRLLGGTGTNYIYARNQFDANTVTSSVVANYGWDFFRVRQNLTIDKPLTLTSPDTLITKELSINNSGQLIFDGTVIS